MKPEGCPTCRVTLVWMPGTPPAQVGFCEGCGAWWIHKPDSGTQDATEACYALLAPGLAPEVDLAQVRADDLRGRTMRAYTAQRMRRALSARGGRAV